MAKFPLTVNLLQTITPILDALNSSCCHLNHEKTHANNQVGTWKNCGEEAGAYLRFAISSLKHEIATNPQSRWEVLRERYRRR